MLTFEQWCELNGKRWTGCRNFEEFRRNAGDYQAYRDLESDAAIARATVSRLEYAVRSDPDVRIIPGDTGTD